MTWTLDGRKRLLAIGAGNQAPSLLYVALYSDSADPSTSPTELVVTGYAREQVVFVETTPGTLANTFDVTFPSLGAGAFTGVGILDDPSAGLLWAWDDMTGAPITIPGGADVNFAAGQLTLVLDP